MFTENIQQILQYMTRILYIKNGVLKHMSKFYTYSDINAMHNIQSAPNPRKKFT